MSSQSDNPPVIFYGYDASPFAWKVRHILTFKGIPYQYVEVPPMLPRPDLSELLGINYRRIPLLAIGNDMYCDTSVISYALERRFPASKGYGTIFPPRKNSNGKADTGMIKAFAKYYPEKTLFPLAVNQLPWHKFKAPFLEDREQLNGAKIDPQAMAARQPFAISVLSANLALVEEQLSDDREWLFDTEQPSLADISVYFIYNWIQWKKELFDAEKFQKTIKWLGRLTALLKEKNTSNPSKITGSEAAKVITSFSPTSDSDFGFDIVSAKRLCPGLEAGAMVLVTPEDSGRQNPTLGKLVGLNDEEFVLETKGSSGVVKCHLPRLGFTIKKASENKL